MTTLELRRALAAEGIREYQTMAGWLPLAEFDPYGLAEPDPQVGTPAGPNYDPRWRTYHGEIIRNATGQPIAVEDAPAYPRNPELWIGRFPVRT
jgi:hypothetical protein